MQTTAEALIFCQKSIQEIATSFGYDLTQECLHPSKSIRGLTHAYLCVLLQAESSDFAQDVKAFTAIKILTISPLMILHSSAFKQGMVDEHYILEDFYTTPIQHLGEMMQYDESSDRYGKLICKSEDLKQMIYFYAIDMRARFSAKTFSDDVFSLYSDFYKDGGYVGPEHFHYGDLPRSFELKMFFVTIDEMYGAGDQFRKELKSLFRQCK
jgi:hypothetical protein